MDWRHVWYVDVLVDRKVCFGVDRKIGFSLIGVDRAELVSRRFTIFIHHDFVSNVIT